MKEPRRLLSHGATDFERQLLRAVVSERPSAVLRSRMQRGLGLVGPLAWASNVKAMLGTTLGKVSAGLALGAVLAVAGATVVNLADSDEPEASTPVFAAPVALTPAAPPAAALPPPPVLEAAPPAAPAAEASPAMQPEAAAPAVVGSDQGLAADDAPGSDRQLREEIALLDQARSALQRGERDAARTSLAQYRERFPEGMLRREANVLSRRADAKAKSPAPRK